MKPKPNVQLQALATLLATVVTIVLLGHRAAAAIAPAVTVGGAIWAWFGLRYLRRSKRWPLPRSTDRASKDRIMIRCFVVGLLMPAVAAWATVALGDSAEITEPPLGDGLAVVVALCVVLAPLSMLVSSSVDWYLIRPFREGAYGEPACRRAVSDSEDARNHLKYWVMHRLVSEFVVWAAVTVAIAFVTAIAESATASKIGQATLNLVGLLGILGWTTSEVAKLRPAIGFIRYPSVGLGQWVTGRNTKRELIRGFVLDVALDPGVQLIQKPRGHPCGDISVPDSSVALKDRDTLTAVDYPAPLCRDRCEFWVPDCEVGLRGLNTP